MVLLGAEYASSDEESSPQASSEAPKSGAKSVVAAPDVSLDVWSHCVANK